MQVCQYFRGQSVFSDIIVLMNMHTNSRQSGFTVIELIFVSAVLIIAGFVAFFQINNLKIAADDIQRKTAINAIHYSLEEVYFKKNGHYPQSLTSKDLPSVDPQLFTDPDGFTLGNEALSEAELEKLVLNEDADPNLEKRLNALQAGKQPNYHYDATECNTEGKCKSYTLRADLVGEAQYTKKSR